MADQAQLKSRPFACDVYSYAILAWQVLSGRRPYQRQVHGMTPLQVLDLIANKEMRPLLPGEEESQPAARKSSGSSGSSSHSTPKKGSSDGDGDSSSGSSSTPQWPVEIVDLVKSCWQARASSRPSFSGIVGILQQVENNLAFA